MITYNLAPVFAARGIEKPLLFLVKNGFSYTIANSIINRTVNTLRFSHLELLCGILRCEPNDIFVYTPDKNHAYPTGHPLYNLNNTDTVAWQNELSDMSFKELKQLTQKIITGKENKG